MRRLPLDFRDQYFGCEIELTGINRATAAQTLADLFGTRAEHSGGGYDAYRVKDLDGKEWKIVRDGSIHPECRRRSVLIGETYTNKHTEGGDFRQATYRAVRNGLMQAESVLLEPFYEFTLILDRHWHHRTDSDILCLFRGSIPVFASDEICRRTG